MKKRPALEVGGFSRDMIDELTRQDITLPDHTHDEFALVCPRCKDSLKVKIIGRALAEWDCSGCLWSGSAGDITKGEYTPLDAQPEYIKPDESTLIAAEVSADYDLASDMKKWHIADSVLQKNRVTCYQDNVMLPYFLNGALLGVKYIPLHDLMFTTEPDEFNIKQSEANKNMETCFFGLDGVRTAQDIIIAQDEFQMMALESMGYKNVIAVPNGSHVKSKDRKHHFDFMKSAEEVFKPLHKIYLAINTDAAGKALTLELSRRIGIAKCYVVEWPQNCSTPIESLSAVGHDVTAACINEAKEYPISGLYNVMDFQESLVTYFEIGMASGVSTGFESMDKFYTVMPGELTVLTGIPNSGKSEFMDAILVNLGKFNDWKIGVFSPEHSKEQHVVKLAEKIIGKPSGPNDINRMSKEELLGGVSWIAAHFFFVVADDEVAIADLEWILDKATSAIYRYGIKGFLLDPWNEIEHKRPAHIQEHEYIGMALSRIKRWARNHGVHAWVIAHPTKIKADKDGNMPPPTAYDISGSSNWANKPDNIIVVYISPSVAAQTIIYVRKVRLKHVGRRGQVTLNYDKPTGRYCVPPEHADFDSNAQEEIQYDY